jgi:transcriptional regulator with XRE-family HTH domain
VVGDLQGVWPVTASEAGGIVHRAPRTPNAVLRGIRESERNESRNEFAEAMARLAEEMGVEVYPDGKYVQRLESGDITWPHRTYRNILERLCARPARELGFAPSLRPAHNSGEASSCVNVRLREAVWESGMEVTEFARRIGVDPKTAERWITRGVIPQPQRRWKASLLLGIDESEIWPETALSQEWPQEMPSPPGEAATVMNDEVDSGIVVTPSQVARSAASTLAGISSEEDQEEMERRRLLQSLAVLGISASPLSHALETVRTAFGRTVGYDGRNHLDDWEETIIEYGYSYLSTPPVNLIPDLATDLVTVRSIMRRISDRDSTEYRSWCRVGGALSALMAKSLSNLSQSRNSREWWRMAQHLADASGDLNLGLLVRGEHIIHGLYENRPIQTLMRQVQSASEFASDYPCVGLVDLSGARAQVSVLAGDYRSAEEDLYRTEEILGRITSSVAVGGTGLVMLWGEAEFRYTEAWVYSHMGEEAKTDRAAGQALSLYSASDIRSPVQIKLMQAFTRIRRGDITEGIQHAQAVYEPLAFGRTTMVDALARQVLSSTPVEAQRRSDVAEYRTLVASRMPAGTIAGRIEA